MRAGSTEPSLNHRSRFTMTKTLRGHAAVTADTYWGNQPVQNAVLLAQTNTTFIRTQLTATIASPDTVKCTRFHATTARPQWTTSMQREYDAIVMWESFRGWRKIVAISCVLTRVWPNMCEGCFDLSRYVWAYWAYLAPQRFVHEIIRYVILCGFFSFFLTFHHLRPDSEYLYMPSFIPPVILALLKWLTLWLGLVTSLVLVHLLLWGSEYRF